MQFTVSGRVLAQNIGRLQRISGRGLGNILISADKSQQHLELHGQNAKQGRRSVIILPAAVRKSGKLYIEIDKINGICKNRSEIEFTASQENLTFRAVKGYYRGNNIALPNYQNLQAIDVKSGNGISSQLQKLLLTAIKVCTLSSMFSDKRLSLVLLLKQRQFFVMVADRFHAAVASFPLSRKHQRNLRELNFNKPVIMPVDYAEILAGQFTAKNLRMYIDSNRVRFVSAEMLLELPALQSETVPVQYFLQLDDKLQTTNLVVRKGQNITGILNSLRVLNQPNTPLYISAHKGKTNLQINYTSVNGVIRDNLPLTVPSERDITICLEPRNFYDIARKLQGEYSIGHNASLISLSQTNGKITVKYYSAVMQDRKRR